MDHNQNQIDRILDEGYNLTICKSKEVCRIVAIGSAGRSRTDPMSNPSLSVEAATLPAAINLLSQELGIS